MFKLDTLAVYVTELKTFVLNSSFHALATKYTLVIKGQLQEILVKPSDALR